MATQLCIIEGAGHERFGPLTQFRPVFDLRSGVLTLREKMLAHYGRSSAAVQARGYLQEAVRARGGAIVNEWEPADRTLILDGRIVADPELPRQIPLEGEDDVVYTCEGEPVAARVSADLIERVRGLPPASLLPELAQLLPSEPVALRMVRWPWDLVSENARSLTRDFWKLVSRDSGDLHVGYIHPGAYLLHPECVRVGPGSEIQPGAVLDARGGPIFIGRDVRVMAGAVIEGPAAVMDGSVVKIHAKIYSSTTIGPSCKVGGEVDATIFHGYSNKQHDGYLGHSYIGEWCNLGAGTTNSDLKNNYSNVRVELRGEVVDTGHLFVGLTMGDHVKSGIGTCFNTGSFVGSCSNIYGAGLPPKTIPAFSWGGAAALFTYDVDKCVAVARAVTARRGVEFGPLEEAVLRAVFADTAEDRRRAGLHPDAVGPGSFLAGAAPA